MHLYVAGPMRKIPRYNFPMFARAAEDLRSLGHRVISPAEMDAATGFDPGKTLEEQNFDLAATLREDFRCVLDCDGIILLPGWEWSEGAKAERLIAEMSGRKVFYYDPNAASPAARLCVEEGGWRADLTYRYTR